MQRVVRPAMALIALCLLTAACGGGGGVGGGLKADGTSGSEGAIGQATTTTSPPTTAPVATTTTAKPTVTTAAAPPCHVVYINNDDKGRYFEPASNPELNTIDCTAGRFIRFSNRDDDPRRASGHSLHSEPASQQFVTPLIPPNATYDVKVTVRGTYSVKDDQRPYAELTVRVT